MTKIASLAAAVAIFAAAGLVASAAQAGPFFHPHHGYWGGPHFGGGIAIVTAPPMVESDCYTVRRKVFIPGAGVIVRRAVVCG